MADEVHQEQQFDLHGYLRVLWKRKWLIIGFTVALTAAVGVGTYFQPRVYVAKVTLLAGRENPRLLTSHPIPGERLDRKSTRLNSSHLVISYAVFCLKKKKT